ncbi:hypothetical protein [Flavobacterium quisquiliarum]|uniref:Lipoprotein n=1 Tax=Flavobacterium quisquiliarum TaxID=1834436 RepID=A0ABV8W549_9FLAO|nr:hypothetical protein [Flavobacterium quisquiliarum]MBW1657291.1 hypothetical protein [Flavobacterium quisquiliarum]NWL02008.1 hypothetical protein [Flavobacterium collinsii]
MLISKRKIQVFIILFVSTITLTSFTNYRSIHVKFNNKTGEDIESLVIAGTPIGSLKNGSSTKYIDFKSFLFDGKDPYEQISGFINNLKVSQLNYSWCGTERNRKSKGSYVFDLKKEVDENGTISLYLTRHNEEIILK